MMNTNIENVCGDRKGNYPLFVYPSLCINQYVLFTTPNKIWVKIK